MVENGCDHVILQDPSVESLRSNIVSITVSPGGYRDLSRFVIEPPLKSATLEVMAAAQEFATKVGELIGDATYTEDGSSVAAYFEEQWNEGPKERVEYMYPVIAEVLGWWNVKPMGIAMDLYADLWAASTQGIAGRPNRSPHSKMDVLEPLWLEFLDTLKANEERAHYTFERWMYVNKEISIGEYQPINFD
jgi:hypothetical protein